jgi:tetratricopeptide (TPR) repeat protein
MNISQYLKWVVSFFALVLVVSCGDEFLDKPLQGKLNQESFPTTPEDALAATNAIYQTLRQGIYHRGFYPIDDIMSDDATKGSNPGDQAGTLGPFESFQHTVTSEFVVNWWRALYQGIRRSNVVLDRVPRIQMDETLKNRFLGEAKFLRALFYFDLARGYGGVPLITSSTVEANQVRSSVEEVYQLINSDLKFAIANLPEKTDQPATDLGRATRGAAKALLGRAYLYQQKFDSAALYSKEVIDSDVYDLEPDFDNANSVSHEHGIESVFEIGGIGALGGIDGGNNQYTLGIGVRGTPNRGFGFDRPSLNLINSFEAGDPRMQSTVIFLGETLDGILIEGDPLTPDETKDENGNLIEMETYSQKVWVPGTTVAESQGHNRRLIRFAEVLLNAAEAFNEMGNAPQALIYLNRVRERAREGNTTILPDITTTNKDALRDIILEERRHELAMEGFRFWDVVRMGKGPDIFGPLGFQAGKHELLPIPQSERDLTQNRLTQNPGWE